MINTNLDEELIAHISDGKPSKDDVIIRLKLENERLRAALKLFVGEPEIAGILWHGLPDSDDVNITVKLGRYREAAEALNQQSTQTEKP